MKQPPINSAVDRGNHHFVLYAKGHYQETDQLTDLKKIMSHRCGYAPDRVRTADILHVLLDEVQTLISKKHNGMRNFITRIREDFVVWPTVLKTTPAPTLDDVLITACLGELASATINEKGRQVYDIGEPDPAVLPLKPRPRRSASEKRTAPASTQP